MTIIIETPAPPTRERLVLVPLDTVSREAGAELLTIRTANARDATPDDLARAGYVLRGGREDLDCVISDLTAQVREAEARAEKAEAHIKGLHDAEHDTRGILDAVLGEPTADAATRLHNDWVDTRERAEKVERERDEARAELARLTAPVEGEPTDEEILDAWQHAGAGVTEAWLYRAGVARERARQARTEPRATDEELFAIADAVYEEAHGGEILNGLHEIARRVAAHVRAERCLVTRAVGMEADVSLDRHPRGLGERAYTLRVQCPTRPSAIAADVPASEVPARVARLLGEVSK